ncbi:MAG TPA: hypothetical protein VHV10_12540 [Ktedonobacteraceae bacterium]|jgi:hypothetical protein|nr:hypothetical protein [Ktedonobacteraceae bacterium]
MTLVVALEKGMQEMEIPFPTVSNNACQDAPMNDEHYIINPYLMIGYPITPARMLL